MYVYIYICTYTSTPLRKLAFYLDFFILVFLSIVGFLYHHAMLSLPVCPLLLCFIGRAVQVSGDIDLTFNEFGEGEVSVRWPIALSFGRRSQLKLNVCLERTPDEDEDVESFFSVDDAGFEEGEIQASDLTPQGSCFECIVCSFRIMTLRSHTDSLPGAVRESW